MAGQALELLIVDDEQDVPLLFRHRFRRRVRKGEVELHFAANGLEALEVLRGNENIHIVLSDINMPEMDGLKLLAEVQKLGRVVSVVIVSAYGDLANIRTAMNRGSYDFLTKPLDFDDLTATLEKTNAHVEEQLAAIESREHAVQLEQRNRFVRSTFGRYVSDDVVAHLLEHPEGLTLGGERRDITTLASDMRGFTALADRLEPEAVLTILNEYFEAMFEVILRHGGTINAILGDGLFVFFGVPISQEDAPTRAVACAVEMMRVLEELKGNGTGELSKVTMGIGIHSGNAVVGNIGSQQRTKYSAIGIDVNLAARIEGYTVGGQILISDATRQATGDTVQVGTSMEVQAKGVRDSLVLHEVVGLIGDPTGTYIRKTSEMRKLSQDVQVHCAVVNAGRVEEDSFDGALTSASLDEAMLDAPGDLEPLTNLRLQLVTPGTNEMVGEVYAKVLTTEDGTRLGLTSVPPEVRAFLDDLLGSPE
jgi:adenylate cyclase